MRWARRAFDHGPDTVGPFTLTQDGLKAAIRLQPKARRTAIVGLTELANGERAIKVSVSAVPEKGRANAALIGLLAKTWKMPKSSLTIAVGQKDRNKVLHVTGEPRELRHHLEPWLRTLDPSVAKS